MKPNKPLPKIGPGLGSRSRIWSRVLQKLSNPHLNENVELPSEERSLLARLSQGETWIDFVPSEWVDIHAAYYEESRSQPMDEREIVKIDKDVPRTFGLFMRNARLMRMTFPSNMNPYFEALKEVLILAARDRGYCQGINFLAASFLIHTGDRKKSGVLMSFLLKHRRLEILFDPRYSTLLDYMKIFEKRLRKYCPRLYRHFKRQEFTTVSYAIEWFTTCFIVTCPGELSLCVFDLLLAGFDDIMIRIGLGLLVVLEDKLLKLDFEGLHQQFKQLVMLVDPYLVMIHALQFQFHRKMSILDGMSLMIDALEPGSNGNLNFSSGKGSPHLPSTTNETTYIDEEESEQDDSPPPSRHDSCAADGEDCISDVNASPARLQRRQLKGVSKFSHQVKHRLRVWRQAMARKGKGDNNSPSTPVIAPSSSLQKQSQARVVPPSLKPTASNTYREQVTLSLQQPSQVPSPHPSAIHISSSSTPVLQTTAAISDGKAEATVVKPSYVYHNPKPVDVLTNWWNDTWRNAMGHGNIEADGSYNSVGKKQAHLAVSSNNGTGAVSSSSSSVLKSKMGQQLGNRPEVHDTAFIVTNEAAKMQMAPSLKPPAACTPSQAHVRSPLDYDGDTEVPVIGRVESPTAGNPAVSCPSSGSTSMSNKGAPKLTEDIESTYLDQGGELAEEIDLTLQLSNFRIALALENLEENWFHSLRRKVAKGNLKVRAKHQQRSVRGIEAMLNQGFASAAASASSSPKTDHAGEMNDNSNSNNSIQSISNCNAHSQDSNNQSNSYKHNYTSDSQRIPLGSHEDMAPRGNSQFAALDSDFHPAKK